MTNLITRTELETLVSSQSVVLFDALGMSPSSFQTTRDSNQPRAIHIAQADSG